jgi:hypothetical protein
METEFRPVEWKYRMSGRRLMTFANGFIRTCALIGVVALGAFWPMTVGAEPPGTKPTQVRPAKPAQPAPAPETPESPAPAAPASPEAPSETPEVTAPESIASAELLESGPESLTGPGDEVAENETEQGSVRLEELNLGEPAKDTGVDKPFFKDTTLRLHLRNYYFLRQRFDNSHAEAWAQGGWLAYKSGYLADRFAVGAALYGSFPLYAPDSRDGTGLLQEDQEAYLALGQIYGEVKIIDALQLNFGRKEYNTPFINLHDVRMTPKTFQGVTLTGRTPGKKDGSEWRYGGGYIYMFKDWTETDFESMSDAFGISANRGVYTAGFNYSTDRMSIGAIDYFSDDTINIFYTEGSYGWRFNDLTSLKLSGQFTDQRSTGDELITGTDFDVQQYGAKADVGIQAATVTLAFTQTTDGGENMRSPWGGYPGYTSVQFNDFNRSGESAFMIKAGYDFTALGATGLSAYALWVHGWNRDVDGTFNEDEFDFNVQWAAPPESKMKNFAARVRYAKIIQDGGDDDTTDDFRVILNWSFNIK